MPSRRRALALAGAAAAIAVTAWGVVRMQGTAPLVAGSQQENRNDMKRTLEIQIGQPGDTVGRNSGLAVKRSQVGAALLYDASPDRTGYTGEVTIRAGARQVVLPACESALFYDDAEEPHGVEQVDLRLRMPAPAPAAEDGGIEYERQLAMDTVQRINAAGWKRYIGLAEPRLAGRDTLDLEGSGASSAYVPSPGVSLGYDPDHRLSFEEWQRLGGSRSWNWYADGVFVTLRYEKDPARSAAPHGVPSDSLQLTVETARLVFAKADPQGEGNAERAIEQERRAVHKAVERRLREEARAAAAGLRVLREWEDPVVAGVAVPRH